MTDATNDGHRSPGPDSRERNSDTIDGRGTLSQYVRDFLQTQSAELKRFQFLALGSPDAPMLNMEITRTPDGELEVRVPPRLPSSPIPVPQRTQLVEAGFRNDDAADPLSPWQRLAVDPGEAVEVIVATMSDVFGVSLNDDLSIFHGSHEAEHLAEQQLDALRTRIEPILTDMLGEPPSQDAEGDYQFPAGRVQVVVAPRVIPGAMTLVRVFAITNVGVTVTPELGLFLARLNFGLMFGRFALDAEHQAIWFDETLPGDAVDAEHLRFLVDVVIQTASEWDLRLQQMFGGTTHQDVGQLQTGQAPKPGTGGYL